jgi:hypothetical protein
MNPTPPNANVGEVGMNGESSAPFVLSIASPSVSRGTSRLLYWLRQHAFVCSFRVSFSVIALGGGALVWERAKAAGDSQRELSRAEAEFHTLRNVSPPLSPTTTKGMETQLSAVSLVTEELRGTLGSWKTPDDTTAESRKTFERADAYFEIAAFVERMRREAASHRVKIEPDEQFGFSDFARSGPELTEVALVLRERRATESLLAVLFRARPHQLLAVQRQKRGGEAARPSVRVQTNSAPVGGDYFVWNSRVFVGLPAETVASALRISFIGQTVSLRTLLNDLAKSELPLFVRAVEVESMAVKPEGRRLEGLRSDTEAPLVPRSQSRFAVTVEWIEWNQHRIGPSI